MGPCDTRDSVLAGPHPLPSKNLLVGHPAGWRLPQCRPDGGKQGLRRWRSDRALGTPAMDDLSVAINAALGNYLDERTNRVLRGKRYVRKRAKA